MTFFMVDNCWFDSDKLDRVAINDLLVVALEDFLLAHHCEPVGILTWRSSSGMVIQVSKE